MYITTITPYLHLINTRGVLLYRVPKRVAEVVGIEQEENIEYVWYKPNLLVLQKIDRKVDILLWLCGAWYLCQIVRYVP